MSGAVEMPWAITNWPLQVILVESPSMPALTAAHLSSGRDLQATVVPDAYAALLELGEHQIGGLILPTDMAEADPAVVTERLLAHHDISVLIAVAYDDQAATVARRAVAAGCSALLPLPLEESQVRAALCRSARLDRCGPGDRLIVGELAIDAAGMTVTGRTGHRVQLSTLQFACLFLLARAYPRPVHMSTLAEELNLTSAHDAERTRRLVARLRRAIAPVAGHEAIENVRGMGYRLRG